MRCGCSANHIKAGNSSVEPSMRCRASGSRSADTFCSTTPRSLPAAQELHEAALLFQDAAVREAAQAGAAPLIEATIQRALVNVRRGDHARAAADLDQVSRQLDASPAGAFRSYMSAELEIVRAQLPGDRASASNLQDAIGFFSRSRSRPRARTLSAAGADRAIAEVARDRRGRAAIRHRSAGSAAGGSRRRSTQDLVLRRIMGAVPGHGRSPGCQERTRQGLRVCRAIARSIAAGRGAGFECVAHAAAPRHPGPAAAIAGAGALLDARRSDPDLDHHRIGRKAGRASNRRTRTWRGSSNSIGRRFRSVARTAMPTIACTALLVEPIAAGMSVGSRQWS